MTLLIGRPRVFCYYCVPNIGRHDFHTCDLYFVHKMHAVLFANKTRQQDRQREPRDRSFVLYIQPTAHGSLCLSCTEGYKNIQETHATDYTVEDRLAPNFNPKTIVVVKFYLEIYQKQKKCKIYTTK